VHCRPDKPAWYLSQWFVELSTEAREYDYTAVAGSSFFGEFLAAIRDPDSSSADAAAIVALAGAPVSEAAAIFALHPARVESAMVSLRAASTDQVTARVQAGLLALTRAGIDNALRVRTESLLDSPTRWLRPVA
jgi:hypothetical protein